MSERTHLIVARCAIAFFCGGLLGSVLVFFFVGLLVPALLYGIGGSGPSLWEDLAYILAFAFLFLCEAAALGLGIVGRRYVPGRVAMIGAAILLVLQVAPIVWAIVRLHFMH